MVVVCSGTVSASYLKCCRPRFIQSQPYTKWLPSVVASLICVKQNTFHLRNMLHEFMTRKIRGTEFFLLAIMKAAQFCTNQPTSKLCKVVCRSAYPLLRTKRVNSLASNDIYIYIYICRTTQLTSRRCILNIYSRNILAQYFKHAAHSPFFFSLQDAVYFIILSFLVPVIFTF